MRSKMVLLSTFSIVIVFYLFLFCGPVIQYSFSDTFCLKIQICIFFGEGSLCVIKKRKKLGSNNFHYFQLSTFVQLFMRETLILVRKKRGWPVFNIKNLIRSADISAFYCWDPNNRRCVFTGRWKIDCYTFIFASKYWVVTSINFCLVNFSPVHKKSADKIWFKNDKEIKVSPLMPIRVNFDKDKVQLEEYP